MSSLTEPPSPPTASKPLPQSLNQRPSPIHTYHLTRPIAGTSTDLLIQSFDDRILVIITQNQKIGILASPIHVIQCTDYECRTDTQTQASIPQVTQLPHPTPSSSTASTGIPNLPPPPPGLTLSPLLGSPRPDEQALYDLYVSQVATLIWWTLNEVGGMRRPVVVGLALAKTASKDDEDGDGDADGDEVERKRFGEILKMVIEWPGPQ
jgi:proteasome assembly chaperone 3